MRKISELEKYKKLSWWNFVKRLELTQSIEVLKQSLDEARKLVEREAETCGQRKVCTSCKASSFSVDHQFLRNWNGKSLLKIRLHLMKLTQSSGFLSPPSVYFDGIL